MIDEKKLIEDLIPILNINGNMYLAGRILGCIDCQPKVGEWIPVSERLPENIKTVLVTLKEMEQPTIGWYGNIDGWRLSEKEFCCIEHEVIAWMPLPPVFKGE